jgi:hypothetical protein
MYRVRHAQRSVKLSFASCLIERPRFVATKKMKLLSGNPDGLAFILSLQRTKKEQQINDLLLSSYGMNSKSLYFAKYKKTNPTYP